MHPAGRDLTVELGGPLHTLHVYLADAALREAAGGPVELTEELGVFDPLVEQLMLTLDGVVRQWEPAARTYLDHLTGLFAAHLAHHYSERAVADEPAGGLSSRQFAAVCELMQARLAEPVPLADLAAAAALSISQFTRQFKTRTSETPHRFLMRLRVEHACRLLRGPLPIAEVAARCGFSHQEHLTRVMRSRMDTTPAAYRRAFRAGER